MFNQVYSAYKRSARIRGIPFDLTQEEFSKLTSGSCFYCGVEPNQARIIKGYNGKYVYNGIDRVDNSKGYSIGNCVPCCKWCNRMKLGATQDEFLNQIERINTKSKLTKQTEKEKVIVYAYVVADLLHKGHLRALQQAKALGDYLIVGVITDDGVAAYKRRPIIPLEERMELVANLKCVDEVVKQETLDPTENLKRIKPDILVHGDDWPEDYPGAKYMRSINKSPLRTKYYHGQSTTKIIEKIRLMKEAITDGQRERR